MMTFNSDEVSEVLRIFEQKNKRSMTGREWNDYCLFLESKITRTDSFCNFNDAKMHCIHVFVPDRER